MLDFSIVVPTYRRHQSLLQLLEAVACLNYPRDRFEVIVVDDGSAVPLEPAVIGFQERFPVRLLRQENSGPAAARNRGARESRGGYLAFTDDDCLPEPDWLGEIEKALQAAPGAVCGGRTVNGAPGNLPTQATQLLLDYLYERYNPAVTSGAFYPTNNMAVPRVRFMELGGFDERLRFGEDREFCYRWQAHGGPFRFAPQAVIRHSHPVGLGTFLRLHFLYGCGTGRFRSMCRLKGMSSPGYSSPLWYLGLLGYGFQREPGWRGGALSLLLAASQAASLAGVLYARASGLPRPGGNHELP